MIQVIGKLVLYYTGFHHCNSIVNSCVGLYLLSLFCKFKCKCRCNIIHFIILVVTILLLSLLTAFAIILYFFNPFITQNVSLSMSHRNVGLIALLVMKAAWYVFPTDIQMLKIINKIVYQLRHEYQLNLSEIFSDCIIPYTTFILDIIIYPYLTAFGLQYILYVITVTKLNMSVYEWYSLYTPYTYISRYIHVTFLVCYVAVNFIHAMLDMKPEKMEMEIETNNPNLYGKLQNRRIDPK